MGPASRNSGSIGQQKNENSTNRARQIKPAFSLLQLHVEISDFSIQGYCFYPALVLSRDIAHGLATEQPPSCTGGGGWWWNGDIHTGPQHRVGLWCTREFVSEWKSSLPAFGLFLLSNGVVSERNPVTRVHGPPWCLGHSSYHLLNEQINHKFECWCEFSIIVCTWDNRLQWAKPLGSLYLLSPIS